ncbi:MAG: DNA-directed RNA polymerase subunit alpha [Candidatus Doudnabacteria bacterium RIFCSPLOWO2_02_FULL_42_9]|uniref:DNA-directed RNA polymerase subunit alpha n=1 Tax=Candidatus Doudnabacteria bacterium RIFCSPHIGHO2_01_FULL_41_86 TaxID=1817821 RepID=A0A1F5N7R8_9BACT|nr:MAG: DNA-directed RNA polymerase subunit alpha [Candidatus Doudnabacteria bacterium RIFCSPHIGHO2_01_FULL_41_86]OGE75683.1 MAG: DNA-directed RNA polymerase subunit alpha [Candidatus Doudnabacteria bacterium RIFCSPHIGHO2_01_43_10]OGE85669.1 MAG: DNA-directed RNA polymerase subunit alpha [Candidatus Doudnabacteria bacterium RIFCSPHIGHO2_12_FULL_42_22]OGE87165.1 MAG: DNA-directed RNA polymerase subunit alpha [Candidatus Doudnabacteria bacterium RIFCSPHIGHO2_02_FULL_42_25]OGE92003.1 MAG: DNA-dire
MENIPLPKKVLFEDLSDNKYKVVMEPLYPGYGVTLGNSLRRVMLSSLPGAAVVAVKIKGVDHEFSTIPNVKEDVIEIILNLKQLRLKIHSEGQVRLELKVKGEKAVTGADFKKNSEVEIVNPDLHIATLDNKSADLDMEVVVQAGRGYVPVEQRENEKLEIGMIAVDAIYTPVRTVNYDINNVRVGQITNYDELILTIETDGTITGKDAIDQAAVILMDHFALLGKNNLQAASEMEAPVMDVAVEEGLRTPEEDDLKSLGLSNRSYNALLKNEINKISQLSAMTHEQLMTVEGLGAKSVEEIERLLATYHGSRNT